MFLDVNSVKLRNGMDYASLFGDLATAVDSGVIQEVDSDLQQDVSRGKRSHWLATKGFWFHRLAPKADDREVENHIYMTCPIAAIALALVVLPLSFPFFLFLRRRCSSASARSNLVTVVRLGFKSVAKLLLAGVSVIAGTLFVLLIIAAVKSHWLLVGKHGPPGPKLDTDAHYFHELCASWANGRIASWIREVIPARQHTRRLA